MSPRRHLALGLLLLAVVAILGYYTLFKTDVALFGDHSELVVYTEDAGGLRKGAPVLVAGVRWGQVDEVIPEFDRPREERVRIRLVLDRPIRLYDDHTATIESSSVLGGVQLAIDPGSPGAAAHDPSEPLRATAPVNFLASINELVAENKDSIRRSLEGIERVVEQLQTSDAVIGRLINDAELGRELSNAVRSISATFDNAEALTDELRGGRGTLGRLIYDPELYDRITSITDGVDAFLAEARGFLEESRTGTGIIAMLLNDAEAAGDLRGTLESVRSVAEKIDRGEGTLSRLVNDGALAQSFQNAADRVSEFVGSITEGEGTIAKLFRDGTLYDNLSLFTADLLDMSTAIREQEGTIGRLIYGDQIYRQLEQLLRTLNGSLEEAREAAPISTFLNVMFAGF